MTNKEILEKIKNEITRLGYTIKNIDSHSNYELNYFNIKELKGWRFGVFIRCYYLEGTEDADCVHFFTIHYDNIDKFRPSSAVFTSGRKLNEIDNFLFWNIRDYLFHIKYHKVLAYVQDAEGFEFEFKTPTFIHYLYLKWSYWANYGWLSPRKKWNIKYQMRKFK